MALDTIQLRRFTVMEYHRMHDAGILSEDDQVELIDGEIVQMSPIGSQHAACVDRLVALLFARFLGQIQIRVQSPVMLDDHSEPEPDVALLHLKANAYADAHPGPDDILLVVEVADATLDFDRTVKMPRFAAAGIQEAWIVNLLEGCIEVYREPGKEGYHKRQIYQRGDSWESVIFPGVFFKVNEIFPR